MPFRPLTALSGEALETKLKDQYKLPGPYIQYLKKSGQLTDKSAFDNKYNGMLRSYITKTAAREDHDKKIGNLNDNGDLTPLSFRLFEGCLCRNYCLLNDIVL